MAAWDDSADDRMSFEDSDRFEEDSLCSLGSENESVGTLTWRGWRVTSTGSSGSPTALTAHESVPVLTEICAEVIAANFPFEVVEHHRPPVPEQLQLRIAFYAFPKLEDEIRLYSCLANGSMNEFQKGEQFIKHKSVKSVLQIGFHLTGLVTQPQSCNQQQGSHTVSVTFDRGKIISCWCTCHAAVVWCAHVTALCLFRIQYPDQVSLRAPVSESLSRLARNQLQKFAQYLINELPQQILPTAQKLLDELLLSEGSEINQLEGAPDPTAGASAGTDTSWCLDDESLRLNVRKIFGRFSGPAPVAFVDVKNLCCSSCAPPAALEWTNLMGPLRKKEPEGLWNLLFIVRDLLNVYDPNSMRILEVFTEECLAWPQLIMWWLSSENEDMLAVNGRGRHNNHRNGTLPSSDNVKYTSVRLLEEHVKLWKVIVMNPCMPVNQKKQLQSKLEMWHNNALLIGRKGLTCDPSSFHVLRERFKGFKPAIQACLQNWMECFERLGFTQDDFMKRRKEKEIPSSIVLSTMPPTLDLAGLGDSTVQAELDTLFGCAEALHAHGYNRAALSLSSRLANILLKFMDNTRGNLPHGTLSTLASLPSKVVFLTDILTGDPTYVDLAFQTALLGLTMPRGPAPTKLQEVKLTDNEIALHATLKSIPLTPSKVAIVRLKAQDILSGKVCRGGLVLPLIFGMYAFEVLVGAELEAIYLSKDKIMMIKEDQSSKDEDTKLAYKLALYILDQRSQASEKKHAMLCEGIRRYRSDFALTLLWHYKDNEEKTRDILSTLLNNERYDSFIFGRPMEARPEEIKKEPTITQVQFEGEHSKASISATIPGIVTSSKSYTRHVSSDSSDSGNGGGGKGKSGCWRFQRPFCPGTSNSVATKRNLKSRYSKSTKTTRTKRQVKKQRSRELTESDSDSQYSDGKSTREGIMVGDRRDFEVDLLAHSSVAVSPDSSLGNYLDQDASSAAKESRDMEETATSDSNSKTMPGNLDYGFERPLPNDALELKDSREDLGSQISEEDEISLSSCQEVDNSDEISSSLEKRVTDESSLACSVGPDIAIVQDKQPCENSAVGNALGRDRSSFDSVSGDEAPEDSSSWERRRGAWFYVSNIDPLVPCTENFDYNAGYGEAVKFNPNLASCENDVESSNREISLPGPREERAAQEANEQDVAALLSELNLKVSKEPEGPGASDKAGDRATSIDKECQDSKRQDFSLEERPRETIASKEINTTDSQFLPSGSKVTSECTEETSVKETGSVVDSSMRLVGSEVSHDIAGDAATPVDSTPYTNASVSAELSDKSKSENGARKKKPRDNSFRSRPLDVRHVGAESFMLFELAKRVLYKSMGQDVLCLIGTSNEVDHITSRHRGLQLAAFEIGLFALGINNLVTPNWMSRTYSSNVSWVTNEAVDIGAAALRLINEQWEGVLTPSEVIEIASRAARSGESTLTRTAAELALSCLPQANSLTPREIEQAIFLCKDQDNDMLERACASIETASHHGGIQPELLFQIARQWHYLHDRLRDEDRGHHSTPMPSRVVFFPPQLVNQVVEPTTEAGKPPTQRQSFPNVSITVSRQQSLGYVSPEQFVQEQMHQHAQEILGRQQLLGWNAFTRSDDALVPSWSFNAYGKAPYRAPFASNLVNRGVLPHSPHVSFPQPMIHPSELRCFDTSRYLLNAYRVGMRALEGLAARMPDERPESKCAPYPPCSDDIRWLCALAASMGPPYLRQFCSVVVSAVSSPFLLHDLALESARHFALYNPAQLASHLRSPSVSPIVQKCLTIYTELVRHELVKLAQPGYDGFVELLRKTRSAFCMAPGGMAKFNDLLEIIRKAHPRKKELWQMIMVGLSRA